MEHPPLFPPGLHPLDEAELDNHFLQDFAESQTRPQLIAGLRAFLAALKRLGLNFEFWIDGSFSTTKLDPNDVDLVIFIDPQEVNCLPAQAQHELSILLDRPSSKHRYGCDVLYALSDDFDARSYWRGWYGFDRDEQPKGIAQIVISHD